MRLFIGINFQDEIKEIINISINTIKSKTIRGRFVDKDNIHLTLVFIGECDEASLNRIKNVMDEISIDPFKIKLNDLGRFERKQGDIVWIGLEENSTLSRIVYQLEEVLRREGFTIEQRPYIPHVTLGRKVKFLGEFPQVEFNIPINISSLSLMESTSRSGRLQYISLYSKKL